MEVLEDLKLKIHKEITVRGAPKTPKIEKIANQRISFPSWNVFGYLSNPMVHHPQISINCDGNGNDEEVQNVWSQS